MSRERQGVLFEHEAEINHHSARNWAGDFFEQATTILSGGVRHKDAANFAICPDVSWGDDVLFESKGVGRSNESIVYAGRLKKDRALVDASGRDLYYWFWRHRHRTKESRTKDELRRSLAENFRQLIIVDLWQVEQYCWSREIKTLNTGYTKAGHPLKYGASDKGYGLGWGVSMKAMLALCELRMVVPEIQVHGVPFRNIEVYTSRPEQARFIMSFGDDPKTKYLYAFEREVDRLICEHSFVVDEGFLKFGNAGVVTRLYAGRSGLREGLWCNAHMYHSLGVSAAEGAERWFTQCCLPSIKRNRPVPEQKKLKQPFNLFSDGGPETLVVGLGLATFDHTDGGKPLLAFLIMSDGKGMPIGVPAPKEHADALGPDEFYIKDWADKAHVAERLLQVGLVRIANKPRVQIAHASVATAVVDRTKLTDFSKEELSRYKP
jgi:hypothetical protein